LVEVAFSDAQKRDIVARVAQTMVEIEGENMASPSRGSPSRRQGVVSGAYFGKARQMSPGYEPIAETA
jgi:hypothetical protein